MVNARLAALLLAVALCAGRPAAAQPVVAAESTVKAAFLFHFGRFVDWPPGVLQEAALQICVLGDPEFAETLVATLGDKTVQERPLRVREIATANEAAPCRIVYIGAAEAARAREILRPLAAASILTVGDGEGFAPAGAIISFTRRENKVRFVINADAADQAGLRISSQLMKLAVRVIGGPEEAR